MRNALAGLRIALWTTLLTEAVAPAAFAIDGPPMPATPGEIYIGATLIPLEQQKSGDYSSVPLYRENSIETLDGKITQVNPKGHLLNLDTQSDETLTELQVGFALRQTSFFDGEWKGVVRVELSVRGYYDPVDNWIGDVGLDSLLQGSDLFERSVSGSMAGPITPPATGFFARTDPDDPATEVSVGLFGDYSGIDGAATNADGSDRGFLTNFGVESLTYQYDETWGEGDLMMFFDESHGGFKLSRGLGLAYGYTKSRFQQSFRQPGLVSAGFVAPGDDLFSYDYRIEAHTVGVKAAFSAGYEVLHFATLFLNGSFKPQLTIARFEGEQLAPCLTTCDIPAPDITPGIARFDRREALFTYEARAGAGLSLNFWKLRVTGQGGYFTNNRFFNPLQSNGGEQTALSGGRIHGFFYGVSTVLSFL